MNNHTPGPWTIEWEDPAEHDDPTFILAHGGATSVARISRMIEDEDGPSYGYYDAHLIAAAPALLAALLEAVEIMEDAWPGRPIVKHCQNVIAKATGQDRNPHHAN